MTMHGTDPWPEDDPVTDGEEQERLRDVIRSRMREMGLNAAQLAARLEDGSKYRERFYKALSGERSLTNETVKLIATALDTTVLALRRDAGVLTPAERRQLARHVPFAEYIADDPLLGPEVKRSLISIYEKITGRRATD